MKRIRIRLLGWVIIVLLIVLLIAFSNFKENKLTEKAEKNFALDNIILNKDLIKQAAENQKIEQIVMSGSNLQEDDYSGDSDYDKDKKILAQVQELRNQLHEYRDKYGTYPTYEVYKTMKNSYFDYEHDSKNDDYKLYVSLTTEKAKIVALNAGNKNQNKMDIKNRIIFTKMSGNFFYLP